MIFVNRMRQSARAEKSLHEYSILEKGVTFSEAQGNLDGGCIGTWTV